MKKSISLITSILLCSSALALEMHGWTFKDGSVFEAEYMAASGGVISLKNLKGKIIKVPVAKFSEEDLRYIELLNPPKIDLSLGKKSRQRVYPPTYNDQELPRQMIYEFTAKVKQTSSQNYRQELTIEFFNIGEENNGDKNILYSYQKEYFTLNGSSSTFMLTTEDITVTEYVSNGQRRGETYTGYMIIVKDSRGEILASKATRDEWLAIADTLKKLPVGRTFDPETGKRCTPTRPARYY